MIACKEKKKCFTLELNVHGIYRKTVFFSSLKKTYNVVTKVLEMLIICIIVFFFVNIQVYFAIPLSLLDIKTNYSIML